MLYKIWFSLLFYSMSRFCEFLVGARDLIPWHVFLVTCFLLSRRQKAMLRLAIDEISKWSKGYELMKSMFRIEFVHLIPIEGEIEGEISAIWRRISPLLGKTLSTLSNIRVKFNPLTMIQKNIANKSGEKLWGLKPTSIQDFKFDELLNFRRYWWSQNIL